jgi:hypothetical protein
MGALDRMSAYHRIVVLTSKRGIVLTILHHQDCRGGIVYEYPTRIGHLFFPPHIYLVRWVDPAFLSAAIRPPYSGFLCCRTRSIC